MALRERAVVRSSSKLLGTVTPLASKTFLLYQTPMTEGAETKAAERFPSRVPPALRTLASVAASQGAPSRGWRRSLAPRLSSWEVVGCHMARSGRSPVATLVWTPCS